MVSKHYLLSSENVEKNEHSAGYIMLSPLASCHLIVLGLVVWQLILYLVAFPRLLSRSGRVRTSGERKCACRNSQKIRTTAQYLSRRPRLSVGHLNGSDSNLCPKRRHRRWTLVHVHYHSAKSLQRGMPSMVHHHLVDLPVWLTSSSGDVSTHSTLDCQ